MKLFKKNIIKMISIIGLSSVVFCYGFVVARAEKVKKFEQDGMIFVVGKHEPEKRVNPEIKKGAVEKVIVKEKIIERVKEDIKNNEKSQEKDEISNGEIGNNDREERKTNLLEMIQGIVDNLKEQMENVLSRLGIIEKKVDNIDELVETTTVLTNEMVEQNKKIEKLEDKILERDNKLVPK